MNTICWIYFRYLPGQDVVENTFSRRTFVLLWSKQQDTSPALPHICERIFSGGWRCRLMQISSHASHQIYGHTYSFSSSGVVEWWFPCRCFGRLEKHVMNRSHRWNTTYFWYNCSWFSLSASLRCSSCAWSGFSSSCVLSSSRFTEGRLTRSRSARQTWSLNQLAFPAMMKHLIICVFAVIQIIECIFYTRTKKCSLRYMQSSYWIICWLLLQPSSAQQKCKRWVFFYDEQHLWKIPQHRCNA